jgi:hypothetical protein
MSPPSPGCFSNMRPRVVLGTQANYLDSPLCIEEFDLSDRNFRPCPCGYQVRPPDFLSFVANLVPRRANPYVAGVPVLFQQHQE